MTLKSGDWFGFCLRPCSSLLCSDFKSLVDRSRNNWGHRKPRGACGGASASDGGTSAGGQSRGGAGALASFQAGDDHTRGDHSHNKGVPAQEDPLERTCHGDGNVAWPSGDDCASQDSANHVRSVRAISRCNGASTQLMLRLNGTDGPACNAFQAVGRLAWLGACPGTWGTWPGGVPSLGGGVVRLACTLGAALPCAAALGIHRVPGHARPRG